jgi:aminopeptidase N
MIEAYQHYFGPYPFVRDGYKLIEAPYSGMEHQTAVTYGNLFENGYLGHDWTGVGISPRFDFIIIHESGHEWFGNSITAKDHADMWIHEGWTTYLESLYVEYRWGKADALKYLSGYRPKVHNLRPIVAERGVNADPTEDQYFKGALMLNTLRSVIDDDTKWFALIHGLYQRYKYQTILTEDIVSYFNQHADLNLTPVFNQYLRHADIPRLEVLFGYASGVLLYKWNAGEDGFAMPVRVGTPGHWQLIHPTIKWQPMKSDLSKEDFQVDLDHYYVELNKQ